VAHPVVQINYVGQRLNIEELPAFVELAARLRIPFIHFVHLLDGASEVDQTASLVHYPELLARYVADARTIARDRGVTLEVSPAYQAVIDAFVAAAA
jgi:MoaA/NifB/PqqE/SkfB family radical SAM enzyme